MRSLLVAALVLTAVLVTAPSASADAACVERSTDAGFVRAHVEAGTNCADVGVERCTLQTNPENPSHPYWRCTRVL